MHSAASITLARLAAIRKAKAQLDGEETLLLAGLAALPDAPGKEWIREDVAVAMRLAPMTVHHRLHEAADGMSDTAAAKVEARVLERVARQTGQQFTRSLRRAVIAFDTRTADQLARKAREQRQFTVEPCNFSVSELRAVIPAEQAQAIAERVHAIANSWKGLDDRTADHVTHRDPTCRFPGCGRKSRNCELDHVWDWDHGGPTADWNLIPLCPRHHHLKHDGGWKIKRDDNGTVHWTSPNGTTTKREPDPPPI